MILKYTHSSNKSINRCLLLSKNHWHLSRCCYYDYYYSPLFTYCTSLIICTVMKMSLLFLLWFILIHFLFFVNVRFSKKIFNRHLITIHRHRHTLHNNAWWTLGNENACQYQRLNICCCWYVFFSANNIRQHQVLLVPNYCIKVCIESF